MWGSAVRLSAPRLGEHDHHRHRGQAAPRHAACRRRRQRDRWDHCRGTTDHHDHTGGGPRGPQRLSGPVRGPGLSRGSHHERRTDGQSHDQRGDDDGHVQGVWECRLLGVPSRNRLITFTYSVVWWTVGATQMIWQPAPSIPLTSQLFSWRRTASCPSILGCFPPISSSVPCRIVLASPAGLDTYPYHFSLRIFTVVKRSSCGPMACRVLFCTSSLEMWSL